MFCGARYGSPRILVQATFLGMMMGRVSDTVGRATNGIPFALYSAPTQGALSFLLSASRGTAIGAAAVVAAALVVAVVVVAVVVVVVVVVVVSGRMLRTFSWGSCG